MAAIIYWYLNISQFQWNLVYRENLVSQVELWLWNFFPSGHFQNGCQILTHLKKFSNFNWIWFNCVTWNYEVNSDDKNHDVYFSAFCKSLRNVLKLIQKGNCCSNFSLILFKMLLKGISICPYVIRWAI